jgi:hypothetical protein
MSHHDLCNAFGPLIDRLQREGAHELAKTLKMHEKARSEGKSPEAVAALWIGDD